MAQECRERKKKTLDGIRGSYHHKVSNKPIEPKILKGGTETPLVSRQNDPKQEPTKVKESSDNPHFGNTLYFHDGCRRIDFILVYKETGGDEDEKAAKQRAAFEKKVSRAGLEIEHEPAKTSLDGNTVFVKIHGTWDFLLTEAEALRIKMPVKGTKIKDRSQTRSWFERLFKWNPFKLEDMDLPLEERRLMAAFNRLYLDEFIIESQDTFFTAAQRSRMVWRLLMRIKAKIGQSAEIKRLLSESIYEAAYPLHEELHDRESKASQQHSDRQVLCDVWANPAMFYKQQPLELIRKYFGEKVAIYFAWLGYYTNALIPAAIAGLICMLYGLISLPADIPSRDVCGKRPGGIGNTIMCPNGRVSMANVWNLSSSCALTRATHVFDNTATIIFALFMAVWTMMFLEGWKHKQHVLAWNWRVSEAEMFEDSVRPEYQTKLKACDGTHGEQKQVQLCLPLSDRLLRDWASVSAVVLFLCLVWSLVFGIAMYRLALRAILEEAGIHGARAIAFTSLTAACLNLVIVMILDYAYHMLAWYLTVWELPRTERQFENSYTLKAFLFQFMSYYSTLFYVAFLKGRFSSVVDVSKSTFEGYSEACDPAGCMVELLILLTITALGKQAYDNCVEVLFPFLRKRWRKWRRRPLKPMAINTRWEKDYQLHEVPPLGMFGEYLEMVLQLGFVTLFVAAFPLGPLFALINNLMEVRLDAYKLLVVYRRPVAARARDLAMWNKILDAIGHLAVFTNACVVAFTSDFIPRMVYKYAYSRDRNLIGYVEFTLSWYDTRSICAKRTKLEKWSACDVAYCRFHEHRAPPCSLNDLNLTYTSIDGCDTTNNYSYTAAWWHELLGRFVFVVVFENVVFLCQWIVSLCVPDIPRHVTRQMYNEREREKLLLWKCTSVVAGKTDLVEESDEEDKSTQLSLRRNE